jgi:hypothetical protein
VPLESNRVLRALRLFWLALGPKRFYVASAIGLILLLALIGLWHLLAPASRSAASSNKAVAGVSPGITSQSLSRRSLGEGGSPSPSVPELERAIAITDVTEAEERGPRGETHIVAKIGLVPRTTAQKDNIEIRVQFFDLDATNQMHPTNAQVTYQWITPERDWSDPSPKYLVATYLKHRPSRHSLEPLRYGGFVVRVYSDGKLQDEHSKPETLIASLGSSASPPTATPKTSEPNTPVSSSPLSRRSPALRDEGGSPPPISDFRPPTSVSSPSPPSAFSPPPSDSLPKGIPIPNKPGFVQSPYDPKFLIDVRGFPPGTFVNDPNTNKPFRVP